MCKKSELCALQENRLSMIKYFVTNTLDFVYKIFSDKIIFFIVFVALTLSLKVL